MTNHQLHELIIAQKAESFTNPAQVSNAEALGVLIANWAKWDGDLIFETFLAALADANYHEECKQIEAIWKPEPTFCPVCGAPFDRATHPTDCEKESSE